MEKKLASVDVWLSSPFGVFYVNATPEEAFALMTMPCMSNLVQKLIPCYELPEVPEKED